MSPEFGDIVVILIYFLITFGIGISFSRRAGANLSQYFLAGRKSSWWLAGTGMVATTFAADTPLWVAGQVGRHGVAGNWLWWSYAAGGMLTVFFFARLWRRAGVLTDLELIDLRYSGPLVGLLRGFKAIYFGLVLNCIIIAWVNLAMLKIFTITLPEINPALALIVCALITTIYVTYSGLWGVAVADVFQFIIAMAGAILLAIFAVNHESISANGGLLEVLPEHALNFFPDINFSSFSSDASSTTGSSGTEPEVFNVSLLTFIAFVGIQWWAAWYPGNEPGGGGYIAQRIMAAKDEKQGFLAVLWFVVLHYCLRSWPWIIAGLAAIIIYPELKGAAREDGYVYLMRDLLPSPLRGLLLASFMGAYMSTISTQLNWGGSYLINDFYARFIKTNRSEKHYIRISRLAMPFLLIFSLIITFFILESISGAWAFLIEFGAGTGFVLIMRWYWWRLNAMSEIVSLLSSMVAVLVLKLLFPLILPHDSFLLSLSIFPQSLFIIVAFNIFVTLVITFLSAPVEQGRLIEFYKRVRPAGPGWKPIRQVIEKETKKKLTHETLRVKFAGWITGTILIYSLLFSVGYFIFKNNLYASLLLGIVLLCAGLLYIIIKKEFMVK